MVNVSGRNGHDNGKEPPDDVLKASLMQYAKEGLTLDRRIARLQQEHGYFIGKTKLKRLNTRFNIPTVRKPPPLPIAASHICEKMTSDIHRKNGPTTVKHQLAMDGIIIPRSVVRRVMHANDPGGAQLRAPAPRGKIPRKTLTAVGPLHEVHCDGHEKFSSLALQAGPVGIPIYGMRDKWSGYILCLVAVPNARKASTIGHVYLDLLESLGQFPRQITVDHGSETGDMYALQTALRKNLTAELDMNEWPPFVALTSTHNIPIENLWSRFIKEDGLNIRLVLEQGKTNGLFNPMNDLHIQLFQWLWPQIVQSRLDDFRQSWNTHTVRRQRRKAMPSGCTPMDAFMCPVDYGGEALGQKVSIDIINRLRGTLSVTRQEAFQWVEDEFATAASEVHQELGSPKLTLRDGWQIFSRMTVLLANMYDQYV